jgi:predicted GNAT family acetyltransferase
MSGQRPISSQAGIDVVDNPDQSRFEISLDGAVAGAAYYRLEPGRIVFTHTEIDPAYEGRGLAGRLASSALDAVRDRGLVVVPLCPFIAGYIRSHPEYLDLVVPEMRERVATG